MEARRGRLTMGIVLYLVIFTSAWSYESGPYPMEMCAAIKSAIQARMAEPPRSVLAVVMCIPRLVLTHKGSGEGMSY